MTYPTHLIPTTVVGSYPQPDWLVDRSRARTSRRAARRTRATSGASPSRSSSRRRTTRRSSRSATWSAPASTSSRDGEIRRESYSNRFALALDGIDTEHPGSVSGATAAARRRCRASSARSGGAGRSRCATPSSCCANAAHATKITLPGPFTLSQQAQNDFYADEEEMAMDYAVAVNEELRDAEGDRRRCRAARRALGAHRAREGGALRHQGDQPRARRHRRADGRASLLRLCAMVQQQAGGYAFLPQLADCVARADLDRGGAAAARSRRAARSGGQDHPARRARSRRPAIETADSVAARLRAALRYIPAERLVAAPDCGMKYLPRATAFGKLQALAEGAAKVRREL